MRRQTVWWVVVVVAELCAPAPAPRLMTGTRKNGGPLKGCLSSTLISYLYFQNGCVLMRKTISRGLATEEAEEGPILSSSSSSSPPFGSISFPTTTFSPLSGEIRKRFLVICWFQIKIDDQWKVGCERDRFLFSFFFYLFTLSTSEKTSLLFLFSTL